MAEFKGRRFTFGPDRQRFRNAQFRLLIGCKARHVLLIPEFCPGGQRLTCGPTLSTNQMRPWD